MNPEVEKQVLSYLIELAESPPVQAEIQAARVAILNIIETEAAKAVPWGLKTIARVMRWIYKKLKGAYLTMKMKFELQRFAEDSAAEEVATTAEGTDDTETSETESTATGSATITVKDSDGNALEGVALVYTVNSSACEGSTDANGQITVTDLPVGTYSFAATLSGYASGSVDVTVTEGATATGEITITKETTEEESTVSTSTTDVSSAAETAAITSVISSVTSGATEFLERLFTLADTEATRLEAEVTTTTDFFVACRDKIEAVSLRALIAAGRAGEVAAVALLVSKLKDKIS